MKQVNKKPIPGYEDRYSIDEDGKVWKADGSELRPHLSGVPRRNYYQVTLYKPGTKWTVRVHVLMGLTFMGHKSCRKWVIDHDDNDPLNNKLTNLRVIDNRMNCLKDRRNPRRAWEYSRPLNVERSDDVPF